MSIKRALEANAQLAEAGKPGMRELDNPAMLTEPVAPLDATASDPGTDAWPTQMFPTAHEVVSHISVKLSGSHRERPSSPDTLGMASTSASNTAQS